MSRSYTSPVTAHSSLGTSPRACAHPSTACRVCRSRRSALQYRLTCPRGCAVGFCLGLIRLTHQCLLFSLSPAGDPFSGRSASLNTPGMHHSQALKHRCDARAGAHCPQFGTRPAHPPFTFSSLFFQTARRVASRLTAHVGCSSSAGAAPSRAAAQPAGGRAVQQLSPVRHLLGP